MKQKVFKILISTNMFISFCSCSTIPKGMTAVSPFKKEKYLGKWYEISPFDSKFEKGLSNTSVEYSLQDDVEITKVYEVFNNKKKIWNHLVGIEKYTRDDNRAMRKVSFSIPFYSGCSLIALDDEYRFALVLSLSLKHLRILSHEKAILKGVKNSCWDNAEHVGFDTSKRIWIEHAEK